MAGLTGYAPEDTFAALTGLGIRGLVGCGLAGTRDIVSFFKYDRSEANPVPNLRVALGWGVSQTGRVLRHFLYQGFNEDEQGRPVFDGIIDQVGGAGRGSFNHRFAQASRDALQHYNIFYPVDSQPNISRKCSRASGSRSLVLQTCVPQPI